MSNERKEALVKKIREMKDALDRMNGLVKMPDYNRVDEIVMERYAIAMARMVVELQEVLAKKEDAVQ